MYLPPLSNVALRSPRVSPPPSSVGVNMRTYTNVYYDVMALATVNARSSPNDATPFLPRGGGLAAAMNKFTKNSFHVLTGNVDKDFGEYSDGDLLEREEKVSDTSSVSDGDDDPVANAAGFFDNSRKFAHIKYNRRNTVDVLSKTPPRKGRGLGE